jgi:Spy/CpxP family protein refolding chaperone
VLPSSRSKLIAAAVVIVAFLAGIVIGVAGDRFWRVRHPFGPRRNPQMVTALILRRLDRELTLTPQQEAAVKQILTAREQRITALMSTVRPQIRQQIDAANAEIEKVLTPDQRAKFQQMQAHMHHGGRGPM